MSQEPDPRSTASAGRCPICGRPRVERYRPFCSSRCVDIDLRRWLVGSYAIPTAEPVEEAEGGPDDRSDDRRS